MAPSDFHQLGQRDLGGETDHAVVGGMDLEQERGVGADRAFIVGGMRAIGGADFAQARAAVLHQIGQPERAADFDQLAARDHDFAPGGERIEREQHGRGVVVDHRRRLGARERAQLLFDQRVALAAAAAFEVVLEIDRRARRRRHRLDGRLGQKRAAEIGVEHDAGRIDHGTQGRLVGFDSGARAPDYLLEHRLARG